MFWQAAACHSLKEVTIRTSPLVYSWPRQEQCHHSLHTSQRFLWLNSLGSTWGFKLLGQKLSQQDRIPWGMELQLPPQRLWWQQTWNKAKAVRNANKIVASWLSWDWSGGLAASCRPLLERKWGQSEAVNCLILSMCSQLFNIHCSLWICFCTATQ